MPALVPLASEVHGHAEFSADRRYRYRLERQWDRGRPTITYVFLNPSMADGERDDPTNRKLRALTSANGGGGYVLVNLFALIDTHQVALHEAAAVGESVSVADGWIADAVDSGEIVVVGWGEGARGADARQRQSAVRARAEAIWPLLAHRELCCFARNQSGAPRHPLYLADSTPLVPFDPMLASSPDGIATA